MEGSVTSGLDLRQCPKIIIQKTWNLNLYNKGGHQSEKIQWYLQMLGQGSGEYNIG